MSLALHYGSVTLHGNRDWLLVDDVLHDWDRFFYFYFLMRCRQSLAFRFAALRRVYGSHLSRGHLMAVGAILFSGQSSFLYTLLPACSERLYYGGAFFW